jgi:hypothetical protein
MAKDWTGNGRRSIYTTLGASSHTDFDREKHDYYATDPTTIDALFAAHNFNQHIWEPACGEGHLSKQMEAYGKTVRSTDLIDRGYGIGGMDFLTDTGIFNGDIITNPPYKYAQQFVEKSLEVIPTGRQVAMFLKLTFLEGQKRRELFDKYPPRVIYVFSARQKCAINGDFANTGSSAACYAWFVWVKGSTDETIVRWI